MNITCALIAHEPTKWYQLQSRFLSVYALFSHGLSFFWVHKHIILLSACVEYCSVWFVGFSQWFTKCITIEMYDACDSNYSCMFCRTWNWFDDDSSCLNLNDNKISAVEILNAGSNSICFSSREKLVLCISQRCAPSFVIPLFW